MPETSDQPPSSAAKWYDLFSRGARDWLRHDEQVRESVRKHLPQIVSGADVINEGARTVRVPVRMLEHFSRPAQRPDLGLLTAREQDVVREVARGLSNQEIASELYLSLSTVKTHLASVQTKLNVRNRVGIASWAWRAGLVNS